MDKNFERRTFQSEVRMKDDATLIGYAAVFNNYSDDLGGFVERIDPSAFSATRMDDVVALFNHDVNMVLGRTPKTTFLTIDSKGLEYKIELPATQLGRDMKELIGRGDIQKSSFSFNVAIDGDTWGENENGQIVRTIKNISRLWDIGPVTFAAYPDTTVSERCKRFLDEVKRVNPSLVLTMMDMRLNLINKTILLNQ